MHQMSEHCRNRGLNCPVKFASAACEASAARYLSLVELPTVPVKTSRTSSLGISGFRCPQNNQRNKAK